MPSPLPTTRTATPPAKAWRNYYKLYRVLDLGHGPLFPGIHPGPSVFASRDIAETHAQSFLALLHQSGVAPAGACLMEHAGAFPEGERGH